MTGFLGGLAGPALSRAPAAFPGAAPASFSRNTKAGKYRRTGGAAKIDFQGTELLEQASGEAKVQNKGSRVEIEAKFVGFDEATKFGLEYLTYVLWAVSPEGRAVNLGEVVLKGGAGEVKAITDMQTFGMIVTAEPYFAVTQPGNTVVLENVINTSMTRVEDIAASYELVGRGVYSSTNTRIEGAIFGIRSEEHTSELQSRLHLVCRLLLEKKKTLRNRSATHSRRRSTPASVMHIIHSSPQEMQSLKSSCASPTLTEQTITPIRIPSSLQST